MCMHQHVIIVGRGVAKGGAGNRMKRERSELVGAFAAGLRGDGHPGVGAVDAEALGAVLENAVRGARAAWADLSIDEESFAQRMECFCQELKCYKVSL